MLRHAGFSARQEGTRLFVERVLALLPPGDGRRLLDLGSGKGDVALLVHAARPATQVTGIDFAPANVEAAWARAAGTAVTFVCADYLDWQGGGFDMIVADSVLHLIEVPVARLAAKIAADLTPGGIVLATLPDTRMLNRVHRLLRRLWRRTPAAADRLALALAVRLYPDLPYQTLLDRLPYLRLPLRLFGDAEQRAFADAGLTLEWQEHWPTPSLAKAHHQLMVWRRAA